MFLVKNKGRKGNFLEPWEAMLSKCIKEKKKRFGEISQRVPKGKLHKNLLEYFDYSYYYIYILY